MNRRKTSRQSWHRRQRNARKRKRGLARMSEEQRKNDVGWRRMHGGRLASIGIRVGAENGMLIAMTWTIITVTKGTRVEVAILVTTHRVLVRVLRRGDPRTLGDIPIAHRASTTAAPPLVLTPATGMSGIEDKISSIHRLYSVCTVAMNSHLS
jgi:hypothetical protein